MSASSSHTIKKRKNANDIFITPLELAKKHIDLIPYNENDMWLDPCKNDGSYFNQFPTDNKEYCEILEDKDFFNYQGEPDIIIQNPPYSVLDIWIKKNIELNEHQTNGCETSGQFRKWSLNFLEILGHLGGRTLY